ncbi:host-nuclease inhibitor Gam family protein [Beduinella massiliensis]|uniref:host-nuclease inhibitor Gam family protein n=1 Tax=Beduinella massiliensis TaxID=1852363 RepID=UPI000C846D73
MSETQRITETTEPFSITDDLSADWAARKIAEKRRDLERLRAHYDAQLRAAEEATERECAYFERLLYDYFTTCPAKCTKTQASYALPSAKLVLKAPSLQFERDEDKLLAYLKANHPEMVKTVDKAAWADFKKLVKPLEDGACVDSETGEVVDGLKAGMSSEKFEVVCNG